MGLLGLALWLGGSLGETKPVKCFSGVFWLLIKRSKNGHNDQTNMLMRCWSSGRHVATETEGTQLSRGRLADGRAHFSAPADSRGKRVVCRTRAVCWGREVWGRGERALPCHGLQEVMQGRFAESNDEGVHACVFCVYVCVYVCPFLGWVSKSPSIGCISRDWAALGGALPTDGGQ